MGIFDFLKKDNTTEQQMETMSPQNNTVSSVPPQGLLNLRKGDILDLTKYSDSLKNVRASAGWDENKRHRQAYDLDLCAFLISTKGKLKHTVYYHDLVYDGIRLDGDDLTGGGDGDNENIFISLDKIPKDIKTIVLAVVIYEAKSRMQSFGEVHNAYIRLVDEDNGNREICRYQMSEDTDENTAITAAKLVRNDNKWEFVAIGEYSKNSISSLGREVERKEK